MVKSLLLTGGTMPWQQLKARVSEADAESLEQQLLELGAVSVTMQDAEDQAVFQVELDSTPLWSQVMVTGLFEHSTDTEELVKALELKALESGDRLQKGRNLSIEELEDQDWERAWMDDFKPLRFGERLWVCPSWSEPPQPEAVNLMLDPGLAFGSGTHPTTALCLEWLDGQNLQNRRVIDYGCGSGILAIAAVLLGAGEVVAIDNDPQALIATANNRLLNNIDASRLSTHLPGDAEHEAADFVLANILCGPLQELTPILAALTRPGGKLILSGVLSEQTGQLIQSYEQYFDLEAPQIREEWVLIEGTRLQASAS